MKLSRIATVAAAVSLAPAVFLATPALADDGNTVDSSTQTVTEPKKETTDATTQTEQEAKAVLTAHFPQKFVTGSKDWTEFSVDIDNSKGDAVEQFSLRFTLEAGVDSKEHPKAGKSELEYQDADGKWHPALEPSSLYGTVSGTVKDGKLGKGAKRTVKLHIRLGADFPQPVSAHVEVEASGAAKLTLPHVPVGAQTQSASPSPEPNTHGGDKNNKSTESPSPAQPTPSVSTAPSASASPSVSASATASPTPAPATGSDNTASGSSGSADTTQLAATGAGNETPWLIGGSAAALVAGTGMVVAARRRSASRG
ncbi:LAETG motif-containing sortase-dependent surface protein [Streptomyces sp. NPDC002536]